MSKNKTKFIINIDLSQDIVLAHEADELLPIEALIKEFKELYGDKIEVTNESLCDLSLSIDIEDLDKKYSEKTLADYVKKVIVGKLKIDKEEDLNVLVLKEEKEEKVETKKTKTETENKESSPVDNVAEILDEVDNLTGSEDFKHLIHEICDLYPDIISRNVLDVFSFQNYLFSINDGCGLTTSLNIFAQMLEKTGLCKIKKGPQKVIELKVLNRLDNLEYYQFLLGQLSKMNEMVICLDISDFITKTHMPDFRELVKDILKMNKDKVFVFRIPFVDETILNGIYKNLSDVLFIKSVTFVPLTNTEIEDCAKKILHKYNYKMTPKAIEVYNQRIIEEKNDGRFYGVSTINKVVSEIIYTKLLSDHKNGTKDKFLITDFDIVGILGNEENNENISGYEMLDKLIGVDKIKDKIVEIVSQIKYTKSIDKLNKPCIHMQFVGGPGTGKTTIARIVGKIFKEEGILSVGNFYEYRGNDLMGSYVGHTSPKTLQICRDAYGSVLFIDEAYTLYRNEFSRADYGREVLDTLISEMESHRDDMVIIFAGYDEEMQLLMKGNTGLESRIPYRIEFPNYTKNELTDIFMLMVKSKFKYSEGFEEAVKKFFDNLQDSLLVSKEFSNARYVRNLFERTWGKAAIRCKLNKIEEVVLTVEDFINASTERDFNRLLKKNINKLGFN